MYTFDHALFLTLNFDGGPVMDRIMVLCSTSAAWAWLYVVMLWLVWRRGGWRALLLFAVTAGAALGLADMVAGIFKHAGLLGSLWPSFPARLRPMHTPSLEGLVHTVREGGLYGTVSAHAATMTALCVTALPAVRGGAETVVFRADGGGYGRDMLLAHISCLSFPCRYRAGCSRGSRVGRGGTVCGAGRTAASLPCVAGGAECRPKV